MSILARGTSLLFATHNAGKVEEARALVEPFGVRLISAADLGLPVPEETESSFEGNACLKASAATALTGLSALADDSGLCVDALDGDPGVRTADWAEVPGGRDFGVAMERTHAALMERRALQPWTASFRCVLALSLPGKECQVFAGRVDGVLVWPIRGVLGHGYDPMFCPEGETRTLAEMSLAEKNRISHRARAFDLFIARCFT